MSEEAALADANLREIARLRTALKNAQALADHYRGVTDTQRAQLDAAQARTEALQAENAALKRWLGLAVATLRQERATSHALASALRGLLADPYGCPMCDSGRLRNPEKAHWPECPYAIARAVLGE